MRAVVQRVARSQVTVAGERVASIGSGLVVLLGVASGDGPADVKAMAEKLVGLRVFRDDDGRMNRSVLEVSGAILIVSQFTLYGDARKGRRPSFTRAAPPEVAEPLVSQLVETLGAAGIETATGRFGAMMDVEIHNDGPVTILIETEHGRFI